MRTTRDLQFEISFMLKSISHAPTHAFTACAGERIGVIGDRNHRLFTPSSITGSVFSGPSHVWGVQHAGLFQGEAYRVHRWPGHHDVCSRVTH